MPWRRDVACSVATLIEVTCITVPSRRGGMQPRSYTVATTGASALRPRQRDRSPPELRAYCEQGNEGKESAQIRCESCFRRGGWWTGRVAPSCLVPLLAVQSRTVLPKPPIGWKRQ